MATNGTDAYVAWLFLQLADEILLDILLCDISPHKEQSAATLGDIRVLSKSFNVEQVKANMLGCTVKIILLSTGYFCWLYKPNSAYPEVFVLWITSTLHLKQAWSSMIKRKTFEKDTCVLLFMFDSHRLDVCFSNLKAA